MLSNAQSINISTVPASIPHIFATNYTNLQFISLISGSPFGCDWIFGVNGVPTALISAGVCDIDVSNDQYSTICTLSNGVFTFYYTNHLPLQNTFKFSISCLVPNMEEKIDIIVRGKKRCLMFILFFKVLYSKFRCAETLNVG